jgi:hypothetical protein
MIKLQENSLRPVKDSIMPALEFSVVSQIVNNQILIDATGNAFTENNKYISALDRINNIWPDKFQLRIPRLNDNRDDNKQEYTVKFILTLNKELLDYIDNIRQKNSKKDVILNIKINLIFLKFDLFLYRDVVGSAKDVLPVSNSNLMMLICNSGSCFEQNSIEENLQLIIKSSDWVQEFAPVLGLGNFLVVELPILNQEEVKISSDAFSDLCKRINDASGKLNNIKSLLIKGEWNRVVEDSRKIWESLQKSGDTIIPQLISNTTGIETDKSKQIKEAIDRIYGYASDLHHSVGSNHEIKPVFTGDKSDAYMMYTLLVSFINLISYKLKNLQQNKI